MKTWNRSIAAILVLTVTGLFVPHTALCSSSRSYAKAQNKQITQHEPKIKSTPESTIPVDKNAAGKKLGAGTWVLIGLGAAAVIALLAGGGGGGGDDSSSNPGPVGNDTGTVVINAPPP